MTYNTDRASELMLVMQSALPPLALKFAHKLCNEVGCCAEVYLTAFAVYANIVEGYPCVDTSYAPRKEDRGWFAEQMVPIES